MKRKILLPVLLLAAVMLTVVIYRSSIATQGDTLSKREEILNSSTAKSSGWKIAKEIEVDGYIISAAYSSRGKSALAVFRPENNGGWHFQSSVNRDSKEIITYSVVINGKCYDLFWFNGAPTQYAEVTYTAGDLEMQPQTFDTGNGDIICIESPSDNYTVSVCYYDENGNIYR